MNPTNPDTTLEAAIESLNAVLPALQLEDTLQLLCPVGALALRKSFVADAEPRTGQRAPNLANARLLAATLSSMLSAHAGRLCSVRVFAQGAEWVIFPE